MTVLLGGRAAESLLFANVSTSAADDLARATDIARSMVVRFGMDPELGQIAYEPEAATFLNPPAGTGWHPRQYGEATAVAIDNAVKVLIKEAFQRALGILISLEKESLAADELQSIVAAVKAEAKEPSLTGLTKPTLAAAS